LYFVIIPAFQIDVPRRVTICNSGLQRLIGNIPSFAVPVSHIVFDFWVWWQTAHGCLASGRNDSHGFSHGFYLKVIIWARYAERYADLCEPFGKIGLKFVFVMKPKSGGYLGVRCKGFSRLCGHIGRSRCQLDCLFCSLLFTDTYGASLGRCSTAHVGARCW